MLLAPILFLTATKPAPPLIDLYSLMKWVPTVRQNALSFDARWAGLSNAPAGDFATEVKFSHSGEVIHTLTTREVLRTGSLAFLNIRKPIFSLPAKAGTYSVVAEIDGAPAGSMEFSLKPGGPSGWVVSGPWQTHGWLAYPKTGQQRVNFTYYISSNDVSAGSQPKVEVRFIQGSKVLFNGGPGISIYSDLIVKKETPLMKPDRQPVMLSDLAKLNGPFSIQLVVNGAVARSYTGSVSGGKIAPHPGSLSVDPLKHLSVERLGDSAKPQELDIVWLTTK